MTFAFRVAWTSAPPNPLISIGSAGLLGVVPLPPLAYSQWRMQDHTETLQIGSRAPEFLLAAANREGTFSLTGLLASGSLIVEFLRGTW